MTSPIDARPQYILQIPGAGWQPLLAAVFTAAFFLLLTVKLVLPSVVCGVLARRLRDLVAVGNRSRPDPPARRYRRRHRAAGLCHRADEPFLVGDDRPHGGRRAWSSPAWSSPTSSCGWSTRAPGRSQGFTLPHWVWPAAAAALYVASAALIARASGRLRGEDRRSPRSVPVLIGVALVLVSAASAADLCGAVAGGLEPLGPCLWRGRLRHRVAPDLLRAHDADHGPLYDRPLARRQARQRAPDDLR